MADIIEQAMDQFGHGKAVYKHGQFIGYECVHCGNMGTLSMNWDSFACVDCGVWLDKACACGPDSGCPYRGRPDKPEVDTGLFGPTVS